MERLKKEIQKILRKNKKSPCGCCLIRAGSPVKSTAVGNSTVGTNQPTKPGTHYQPTHEHTTQPTNQLSTLNKHTTNQPTHEHTTKTHNQPSNSTHYTLHTTHFGLIFLQLHIVYILHITHYTILNIFLSTTHTTHFTNYTLHTATA